MTFVETMVVLLIVGIFTGSLFYAYRQSMNAYQATSWRQDRTRQVELFWNILRKSLEEATNSLGRDGAGPDWTVRSDPRPVQWRPARSPANTVVLSWMTDHLTATGDLDYRLSYQLKIIDRRLCMTAAVVSGSAPAGFQVMSDRTMIDDIDSFDIKCTLIKVREGNEFREYFDDGTGSPSDPVIGSVAELFVVLAPPPGSSIPAGHLPLNGKFRLAIAAQRLP